jgi:hypothetical protein
MAKKRIFIGSAKESRRLAQSIAHEFALTQKYEPIRWWQAFPKGAITLDRLIEVAEGVDGAIFLFTGDDQTWYRGDLTTTARDNVTLEYGVFVRKLGRQRTLILKQNEVRVPSDIHAISYGEVISDDKTVAELAVEHFDEVFSSYPYNSSAVNIVIDPSLIDKQLAPFAPFGWNVRNLYLGLEGAKDWLATSGDPSYVPTSDEYELREMLRQSVGELDVRTFVSFGPGDARTDLELTTSLAKTEPWLQYIPVDICIGLLQHAINVINKDIPVPVGILGDFEDGLGFIKAQLHNYAPEPKVFALLGNTFGNLERFESAFVTNLWRAMEKADYLLMDVSLRGPKWSLESDRRAQHESYGPMFRRFIANGIARRTRESTEDIAANFETRIKFAKGGSDVPATETIQVIDSKGGRLIYAVRRYHWDSLIQWLEKRGFNIVFKQNVVYTDEILGDGVILASKT